MKQKEKWNVIDPILSGAFTYDFQLLSFWSKEDLEVAAAIMWEAAGFRVWIRSHFQSHFPSHCTMVPARTKRSTKPSVKCSNSTDHDMNGCICLGHLVTESTCSHVCFKVVTVIKRRIPSFGDVESRGVSRSRYSAAMEERGLCARQARQALLRLEGTLRSSLSLSLSSVI